MASGHIERHSKDGYTLVIDYGRQRDETGKVRQVRRKYALRSVTKKRATVILHDRLSQINGGTYTEPSNVTVAEYLRKWLTAVTPGLATRTAQGYRLNIERHVIPALGDMRLGDLRPAHVQSFYTDLLSSGLAPRTVQYVHANLRAALGMAVSEGEIPRNVTDSVKSPRPQGHEMRTLLADEVGRLLDAAAASYIADVVYLALHTGMRRGELLALRWREVDMENQAIHVSRSLVRTRTGYEVKPPKSKMSRRTIPVDAELGAYLSTKRQATKHDLVCCYPDGKPLDPSSVTHTFAKIAAKAGFPGLRFHDLRHSYATLGLAGGIDLPTMQELLGHESISTTRIYVHVLDNRKREAADIIGKVMADNGKHQMSTRSPSEDEPRG